MPTIIDTQYIRQQVRNIVDPMFMQLREQLYGPGVTYNTHISGDVLPPGTTNDDNVGDQVDDLGYIKHITLYEDDSLIVNAKEINFLGLDVTQSGLNHARVSILPHTTLVASPTILGHIKIGDGLHIAEDGLLSVSGATTQAEINIYNNGISLGVSETLNFVDLPNSSWDILLASGITYVSLDISAHTALKASVSDLGHVRVGSKMTIDGAGILSTTAMDSPMTTIGDIIYATTAGVAARRGIGGNGQVLTVISGLPYWQDPSSGFDNPMTTAGDIIYGSTGGNAVRRAIGLDGQVLTVVSGLPTWITASGTGGGGGGGINVFSTAYAARPAASGVGDLFFPTDSYYIERNNGASWNSWGPIYAMTPPNLGAYAWVNQGTATAVTSAGGLYLKTPVSTGANWRILKKGVTAPYVITAHMRLNSSFAGTQAGGLIFRESSTGKIITMQLRPGSLIEIVQWNSETSFSGSALSRTINDMPPFVRIADNNTNRTYSISYDGLNFIQIYSETSNTFMTANEVGFAVYNDSSEDCGLIVLSWREE